MTKIDRIFLDSSILFSAAQMSTGLKKLWELAKNGHCFLIVSRYSIEKVRRNFHKAGDLKALDDYLAIANVISEADSRMKCPIDLPKKARAILMAAISARADYLLTSDRKYFGEYFGQIIKGVKICMPKDYLIDSC